MRRLLFAGVAASVALGLLAQAGEARRFEPSTQSKEARELLAQLQRNVENLVFGKANVELATKIVALDANWTMGVYYQSAVTPGSENQKLLEKAAELAKNAKDGERRFVEAMVIARGSKPEQAIEPLQKLATDYPDERVVHSLLGQVLAARGRVSEARAEYEKAIAIDDSTPRAYTFVGNLSILEGNYGKARQAYQGALAKMPAGAAPGPIRYSVAFSHLYEGQPDKAIESLKTFLPEYKKAGQPFGIPEVFIWNSIARIQLEHGRAAEAMQSYEKGYESVPGSSLEEDDKKLWLGRLHHGKGRTLARMGKYDAAWQEAETVKKMIADAGERGKEFEPAYRYLAGYIELQKGNAAAAIEHLKQSQPDEDPFRGLLLGRAYEKTGDKAAAKKAYEGVVSSNVNNIERALSYPEAKKKLASL